jgi:hypothetical protein
MRERTTRRVRARGCASYVSASYVSASGVSDRDLKLRDIGPLPIVRHPSPIMGGGIGA